VALLLGLVLCTCACGGSGGSGGTEQATDSSGDKLAITVLEIDLNARPSNQFEATAPHAADRTVAVEISLKNLMPSNGYYGTPGHAISIVGANGKVYPADLEEDITHSPVMQGILTLSPGETETEWIPVPIPRSVQPATLRFHDDGGPITDWSLSAVKAAS